MNLITIPEIELEIVTKFDMVTLISYAFTNKSNLLRTANYLGLKKDKQTSFQRDGYLYLFEPGKFSFSCYKKWVCEGKYFSFHTSYTLVSKFSGRVYTLFEHQIERYMGTERKITRQDSGSDNEGDSEKWITIPDNWFSERRTTIGNKVVIERQKITYAEHCEDRKEEWPKSDLDLCTRSKPCFVCSPIYSSVSKGLASKCIPEECKYCDFSDCICDNPNSTAVLTCIDRETLVNGVHLGDQKIDGCTFTIINGKLIWVKVPSGINFRTDTVQWFKFQYEMENANHFFKDRFEFILRSTNPVYKDRFGFLRRHL
jgi:hypothetical protein